MMSTELAGKSRCRGLDRPSKQNDPARRRPEGATVSLSGQTVHTRLYRTNTVGVEVGIMAVDVGGLEIYMGPSELGAPDNLEDVIFGFIGRARSTLDIAVQELESVPIAEAIMQSRASGVRVRVILERDYLTVTRAAADPWQPGGENEANRYIHGALLRARVQVITDLNPNIFHQKFVVSDAAPAGRLSSPAPRISRPRGPRKTSTTSSSFEASARPRCTARNSLSCGRARSGRSGSGTTRARAPTGSRGCASKCSSHRTTRRRWRS